MAGTDEIKADYEQLNQVSSRFANQGEAMEQMLQRLQQCFAPLENGDWIGEGADAFFGEMKDTVLPACAKLIQALHMGQTVSKAIVTKMRQAEEQAAAPFRR